LPGIIAFCASAFVALPLLLEAVLPSVVVAELLAESVVLFWFCEPPQDANSIVAEKMAANNLLIFMMLQCFIIDYNADCHIQKSINNRDKYNYFSLMQVFCDKNFLPLAHNLFEK
jgi:hypothetical protein